MASYIFLKDTGAKAKAVTMIFALREFLTRCKQCLLHIGAFFLLYSQVLRLVNSWANRFQLQKTKDGKLSFPFVKKRRCNNVQILTYHKINDDGDYFFPATPTSVFAKQMEYIAHNFNVCSLNDAIMMLKTKDIPDNVIVITFDDGYRDNYLNAYPILNRLSLPATIFLPTGVIGTHNMLWYDRVLSALRDTSSSFLEWPPGHPFRYSLETLQDRLYTKEKVLEYLWSLNGQELPKCIDYLVESLAINDNTINSCPMLTWKEIKIMHEHGISFGSHTVSHLILSRLSISEVKRELYESRETIEKYLGTPVKSFSYPVGRKSDFNDLVKQLVKEAGYLCALTTIFGANEQGQDLFELRRGGPWERHLPLFATKLNWYKFCGLKSSSV